MLIKREEEHSVGEVIDQLIITVGDIAPPLVDSLAVAVQ